MGRRKISTYRFTDHISTEEKLQKVLSIFELNRAAHLLPEINRIAQKEKLSFYDALDRLFEEELSRREDSRIERWTKQAKFSWTASLSHYDFNYPKSIEKEVVLGLAECDWIERGGNVIFLGPAGVGKTHLSIALGLEAINHGYETRFITARNLVEMIEAAIGKDTAKGGTESRKKLLTLFTNVSLLILDDLAYSIMEPHSSDFLFQLMYERYEKRKSTILTGNQGIEAWEKELFSGNKARTMAVADRFLQNCVAINIKGDSYRPNNANKKKIKPEPLKKKEKINSK